MNLPDLRPEDIAEDRVVIGRTPEGLIVAVMPPPVVATTFMLLASNHLAVNCEFVNALAFHMHNDDIANSGMSSSRFLDAMLESLKDRHSIEEFAEGFIKKGTPEIFDGMYYAEFHPMELAGIAEILTPISGMVSSIEAPTISSVIEMWIGAANAFVRPNERLALASYTATA